MSGDSIGHERVLADDVVNVDRDVSDRTCHELPNRLHAFTAFGKPEEEGVMDGLFRIGGSSYLPTFIPLVDEPRLRIGALHHAAQIGMLLNPRVNLLRRDEDMRTLVLLGDPAARIKVPLPPTPPGGCPQACPP